MAIAEVNNFDLPHEEKKEKKIKNKIKFNSIKKRRFITYTRKR